MSVRVSSISAREVGKDAIKLRQIFGGKLLQSRKCLAGVVSGEKADCVHPLTCPKQNDGNAVECLAEIGRLDRLVLVCDFLFVGVREPWNDAKRRGSNIALDDGADVVNGNVGAPAASSNPLEEIHATPCPTLTPRADRVTNIKCGA